MAHYAYLRYFSQIISEYSALRHGNNWVKQQLKEDQETLVITKLWQS